jgi:hypothetical protein
MGVSEIARCWGVSPGYVSRLKKKGMPLSSLAEADRWRLDNLQKPPRSESGAAAVRVAADLGGGEIQAGNDSPAARLKRAQHAERLAFALLQSLAEGGNAVAMRAGVHAFGEAQRRCSDAELALVKNQQATRGLISFDEVQATFTKHLGGIRQLMDALPSSVAVRANPSDPECARMAVQEGIDQILRMIQASEGVFADNSPSPSPSPKADS